MPQNKRKIQTADGQELDALVMPFQTGGEHFNEYLLDDGSVIRLKSVATEILRVEGQFDQVGNPVYIVSSTNVMAVDAPENLRKGGAG